MRTLIAYQVEEKAFFIYGFAKNKRVNIDSKEVEALQIIATNLLSHDDVMLAHLIHENELIEVETDD